MIAAVTSAYKCRLNPTTTAKVVGLHRQFVGAHREHRE
jgi:hypothetical protein